MKKRINIFVLAGIIFLCFSVWIESRTQENNETVSVRCYGGSLSEKTELHFEKMNNDLKYMKRIEHAQSDRILFRDQDDHRVEYHYLSFWY